jgi:hypothetical protein
LQEERKLFRELTPGDGAGKERPQTQVMGLAFSGAGSAAPRLHELDRLKK